MNPLSLKVSCIYGHNIFTLNALGSWGKLACVAFIHISSMTPPKLGLECALTEGGE